MNTLERIAELKEELEKLQALFDLRKDYLRWGLKIGDHVYERDGYWDYFPQEVIGIDLKTASITVYEDSCGHKYNIEDFYVKSSDGIYHHWERVAKRLFR